MKKLIIISGLIIVASFILSGCGGNNQELKEKPTKDSLEAVNVAAKILPVKLDTMAKQVTIDSLNKINAINKIIGNYTSNEGSHMFDSRGTEYDENGNEIIETPKEEIKWEHLTIKKKGPKIIITQNYSKPVECYGTYDILANAEVLDIKETENGIFNIVTTQAFYSYDICDNLGRIIFTGTSSQFDVNYFANGIYYVKIKLKNEVVIKKIIKNN